MGLTSRFHENTFFQILSKLYWKNILKYFPYKPILKITGYSTNPSMKVQKQDIWTDIL